jgi:dephospho-CoA kinase
MAARSLVGLTGGIGAGKSEALRAFERHGAATISTDEVVHELQRDPAVVARLTQRWGDDIAPGGELDRARVAEIVFSGPEELADDTRVAVVEVPLLFESGMDEMFDAVVAVVADDKLRAQREQTRDLAALEGRAGRQLTQEEKAERATHVIVNDGSISELEDRVAEIIAELESREHPSDADV